ncbi:M15 family metallopeptidase [Roseobacter sp. EG26]|uniref:M15 family metallopeptidase n=1 Tax=Roseobacter sp. EG26 TaxID=3412477 RepID=UPI002616536F|nr:M15 family metallopeptidase [uncultured Roseobacter sp.]
MELRKSEAKAIQRGLKDLGIYADEIDGDLGGNSLTAANAYLLANDARLPSGYSAWPNKRKFVACIQMLSADAGFDPGVIDGWLGTDTRNASTLYIRTLDGLEIINVFESDPIDVNPNNWPSDKASDLNAFYGTPRKNNNCSAIEPRIVKVDSPWRMPLDWNMAQSRSFFKVHEIVAPSLERILAAIEASYSESEVNQLGLNRFSGDYVCRKITGGTRMSTHAYGIAIDFYGSKNELKRTTHDTPPPTLAHADCQAFWEAFENEGWYSLGRAQNYDWMHVQAAKGRASRFYSH